MVSLFSGCQGNADAVRGFLIPENFHFKEGEATPAPPSCYIVLCRAWVERGLSLPASGFFLDVLEKYQLQPHNICPNNYTILSNFQTLMEGHLGVKPDIRLFQYFFRVKIQKDPEDNTCNCGSITFMLRPRRNYPTMAPNESVRYWNKNWFYHKNLVSEAQPKGLPDFKDGAAVEVPFWKECPSIQDHQDLLQMARRIGKLCELKLTGTDLTISWFKRRIQPLRHNSKLICRFSDMSDSLCVNKNMLPSDALERRARNLFKITKEQSFPALRLDICTQGEVPLIHGLKADELGSLVKSKTDAAPKGSKKKAPESENDEEDEEQDEEPETYVS